LIEMLVVLVIIALLTSSVALSLPDRPERRLQDEARRLASALELALSLSQSGEQQLAWQPLALPSGSHPDAALHGYSFLGAGTLLEREIAWQPMLDDARLRSRTLDDDIELGAIRVDGQPLGSGQLLILRGNDPPLFSMQLRLRPGHSGSSIELRSLPNGRIELLSRDA